MTEEQKQALIEHGNRILKHGYGTKKSDDLIKIALDALTAPEDWKQRAEAAEAALERESDIHIDTAASMREWRVRAEAAEAKLAELEKQEPVAYVHPAYLQAGALGFDASVGRLAPAQIPLFTRPAPAVGMDKPEPYAWLVHAPQGDYVERNPEVVAHLEGTGLTKCKPLYLDL